MYGPVLCVCGLSVGSSRFDVLWLLQGVYLGGGVVKLGVVGVGICICSLWIECGVGKLCIFGVFLSRGIV